MLPRVPSQDLARALLPPLLTLQQASLTASPKVTLPEDQGCLPTAFYGVRPADSDDGSCRVAGAHDHAAPHLIELFADRTRWHAGAGLPGAL